jgi:hypothetical protein
MPNYTNSGSFRPPTVLQHLFKNLVGVSLVCAATGIGQAVLAKAVPQPASEPLNMEFMEQGLCAPGEPGISNTSVQQTKLSEPSLWWIHDQIRAQQKYGNQFVDRWLACRSGTDPSRVDVMVNAQAWSFLDFFERYEFVNRFGTVTTGYGYNLRVFNDQGRLLAAYTCNFAGHVAMKRQSADATPLNCEVFDASSKTNFWSPVKPLDGFSPTTGGTAQP